MSNILAGDWLLVTLGRFTFAELLNLNRVQRVRKLHSGLCYKGNDGLPLYQ